jgi:predicted nucleotidyltransferase
VKTMSKNPNRSKLRSIFTSENGDKKPEQSSGILNPFSLNKNQLMTYVYDFIKIMFEERELTNCIKKIILFGSIARGNFDKESDIDIFIDIKNKKDTKTINKRLKDILNQFEIEAKDTWELRGIKLPIKCIVGSLEDKTWEELKKELSANGIILYGKYEFMSKKTRHYALIKYSLAKLSRKDKMKVIRKLFGYETKKGSKVYKQKGLLEDLNGKKLSKNLIAIPMENSLQFQEILNSFKITPRIIESWINFQE